MAKELKFTVYQCSVCDDLYKTRYGMERHVHRYCRSKPHSDYLKRTFTVRPAKK